MKFVKPGDDDDGNTPEAEAPTTEESVTLEWESKDGQSKHTLESAIEANASKLEATEETLNDLRTFVEDQRDIIEEQHAMIEALRSKTDTLNDQYADQQLAMEELQEELASLRKRVSSLEEMAELVDDIDARTNQVESRLPDLENRALETARHVTRLRTAMFDEEQPCPNCNHGHITLKSDFIDPVKIVCDHCNYEEETALP